jgi:aryl-alcohol dehydrogenase-like predicted oxidoreductase
MQRRKLGTSDVLVSRLGLGTSNWGFGTDKDEAELQLRAFVDAGGTLVDTANGYGNWQAERILGELVGSVVPRADVVLATKGAAVPGKFPYKIDVTKAGLLSQIDGSLRSLRTDHVDLYQVHLWEPGTPIEETMAAFDEILRTGRARAVGICNYSGWQTGMAGQVQRSGGVAPLATTQVEYSLVAREVEREVIPAAEEFGMGVLPWGPIGRGVLTGKYRSGIPEERRKSKFFNWYVGEHLFAERTRSIVDVVVACAEELGTTPTAVAISWVRDRPGVVAPLVGARTEEQLRESLEAERVELPPELAEQLDKVSAISTAQPRRRATAASS